MTTAIEKALFHAQRAGAFRAAKRSYPDSAETFEAAANVNSAKAERWLNEALRDLRDDDPRAGAGDV